MFCQVGQYLNTVNDTTQQYSLTAACNTYILGFPKVDHSGINARIVLDKINSAKKKLPPGRLELSTL